MPLVSVANKPEIYQFLANKPVCVAAASSTALCWGNPIRHTGEERSLAWVEASCHKHISTNNNNNNDSKRVGSAPVRPKGKVRKALATACLPLKRLNVSQAKAATTVMGTAAAPTPGACTTHSGLEQLWQDEYFDATPQPLATSTFMQLTRQVKLPCRDTCVTLFNRLRGFFSYSLAITQVFDSGSIFSPEILDIKPEDLRAKFQAGVVNLAAVSLQIGCPTIASAPHSVANGFKNLLAMAVATEMVFKEVAAIKEFIKDPSKFVAAAASVPASAPAGAGAAAEKKEEAKKEESESEEDEDMGFGLFD
ncbi:uncharacterized protein LOC126759289 [Bactrocera neohumeralis]|uniref:uncharacterized protein LOC126759289 n=1 Tax=Bactrocera neohumeralis TaxID=98809 RepID=UPI002165C29E|nr:uncharacterized protein LOC126759289 [Bactrocera neohumeralis]